MRLEKILKFIASAARINGSGRLIKSLGDSAPENMRSLIYAGPGHFYSPLPDLKQVTAQRDRLFDRSVDELEGIDLNAPGQTDLVRRFARHYNPLQLPEKPDEASRYHLDNGWFSYGDGVTLYCMMRHLRPRRIIEIGSGFSSAAMLDTDDRAFGGSLEFTFVEPNPERLRSLLQPRDSERCQLLTCGVQDVDLQLFDRLEANDILFVDSSHVAKIGSDVVHLVFRILPRLKEGVVIHFHDIFWPFEYPESWVVAGRAWNEAYLLRAFLQYNEAFRIVYFNSYLEERHRTLVEANLPLALKEPSTRLTPGNTSLWLVKGPQLPRASE